MKNAGSPSQTRTNVIRLLVLLVILAGVVYWRFGGTAEAPVAASNVKAAAAAPGHSPAAPGQAPAAPGEKVVNALPTPLNFGALEQVPVEGTPERNPFKFYVPPPPPPPPAPKAPPYVPPVYTPPPPTGPPPMPPIMLKYIGKFQQGGKTVVILTDGKTQFPAVEGGIIDGRYRVVKIGVESLQIEYVNGKGLTTLPFKG